jgi:prolyl-tRNA editing enzyme YbaK/EbsC (Cys-tRNA(Pro) deacylase)
VAKKAAEHVERARSRCWLGVEPERVFKTLVADVGRMVSAHV